MPRGLRYLPPGWSAEITTNTTCDFFLLPPTSQFARIFVGVLARAQERHPLRIHAAVAASSHYHLVVTPDDAEQLADFMEFVNGNLAREAGRPDVPMPLRIQKCEAQLFEARRIQALKAEEDPVVIVVGSAM